MIGERGRSPGGPAVAEGTGVGSPTVPEPEPLARLFLGVALALAALRFAGLGTWSLWLDEVLTLSDARRPVDLGNPLGYALFGAFYRAVGGAPDELLLRLPAAVAGFLSVPVTAWALRPLLGRRASAAAALVLAASSWGLSWSQTARFYTTLQLLGLLATGFVVRGTARGRLVPLFLGLAFGGLAALIHPTAVLLCAGLLCAPFVALPLGGERPAPRVGRALLVVLLLGGVAGSGWGLSVLDTWRARHDGADPLHFVLSTGYLATPTVGLGFCLGAAYALRRRVPEGAWLVACCATSLALALAAAFLVRVSAQYVFVLQPLLLGLACLPVRARVPGAWGRRASVLYVAFLLLPGLVDSALYLGVRRGDRPDWRGAYAHVFANLRPGDLVLGMEAPVAEYYLDPRRTDLRAWENVVWLDDWRDDQAAIWARQPRRTWFVVNDEQMEDWSPDARDRMRRLLREECRVTWESVVRFTPRDLTVRVYLRD